MQIRRARILALAFGLLAAGCVAGGSQGTGSPSAGPTGSAPPSGFYLRMWQTQAVAAVAAFGQLPEVTISDGTFIDGHVAIPMIYPGPLWIGPSAGAELRVGGIGNHIQGQAAAFGLRALLGVRL